MSTKQEIITANLNDPQKAAVLHGDGPLLILAGAGSGKTKALTHRIAKLIAEGVPPWQILSVTFTNKAALEMKERIEKLLEVTEGSGLNNQWETTTGTMPTMGTFHSICARILRRDIDKIGRDRSYVIYDTDDQQRLMKMILKEMGIEDEELKPKAALGYISRFKSEALTPKQAESQATTARMQHVVNAYKKYQKALFEANALDFDDILLETVRLFTEVPAVLEKYQNTWKYLHVDEYQDTNHVQYLFITLLAKKYGNLCVIGDPDQSIYAFRGADIRNILEFEKEYKEAAHIKLEQNYRSTQVILDAADCVISVNPGRPEKKMWSERKEGPKVIIQEVADEKKEAMEAIRAVENAQGKGVKFSDQVILYRTNAQSRLFEEACLRRGIPYRIVGGMKFYARREVKDMLGYLHAILNPNDSVALLRIINVPSRKIGLTTIGRLQAYSTQNDISLWDTMQQVDFIPDINGPTKERIAKFVDLILKYQEKAKTEVVSELMGHLMHAIDIEHWLRDDSEEGEARWENVQELKSVMHKYDGLEPISSLTSFLEEVALVSEVDKLQDDSEALTLMTLHLCKGLEFKHVIIAGCEEGIFPHANCAFDREQLEEERRIMYVGMTRARTYLQLMHAGSRMLWGQTQANAPSRFLEDIPESCVERRTDNVLSAFAHASQRGADAIGTGTHQSRHSDNLRVEFNQDIDYSNDGFNQEAELTVGCRVSHKTFGNGTVKSLRGDLVEISFDNGQLKTLAMSIAPLRLI